MIFVVVGGLVLLWFLFLRGHTDPVEDFILEHSDNEDTGRRIFEAVNEMYMEFLIPAKAIVSMIYAESMLDPRAKGDFVDLDYFGPNHFSSFGLGQISTTKTTADQWSTFDLVCEYFRQKGVVKDYNLGSVYRRNNEVRLAINDADSVLYDERVNVFLVTALISLICDEKRIVLKDFEDLKQLARFYNAGMNTSMSQEEWESIRPAYLANLKYAWDSMS